MKYIIFIMVLVSMATNADIDWDDKKGTLPFISMNMIENFIGTKEFCSGRVEGEYSKIEDMIGVLKEYHHELFPESTVSADPYSRTIFSDQMESESGEKITAICLSVQKDIMMPRSLPEYFNLLSKSFDDTKALIDSADNSDD